MPTANIGFRQKAGASREFLAGLPCGRGREYIPPVLYEVGTTVVSAVLIRPPSCGYECGVGQACAHPGCTFQLRADCQPLARWFWVCIHQARSLCRFRQCTPSATRFAAGHSRAKGASGTPRLPSAPTAELCRIGLPLGCTAGGWQSDPGSPLGLQLRDYISC